MQHENAVTYYGLRALATVIFDIDSGQKLDALYPPTCGLSDAAKTSLALLSLPHGCNKEGDVQFIVRFRDGPDDPELLYGFVLFRQQKDETRARGYFQKALILICTKPYVDLYERLLRAIGPLFFKLGSPILAAVYNNISSWPKLAHGIPVVLPLAGTYISCIIPNLLNYEVMDTKHEVNGPSPLHSHFIVEEDDDATDVPSFTYLDEDDVDGTNGSAEESVLVRGGKFVVSRRQQPPSPSFGDLLLSKRSHQLTSFENIGLYSSFLGLAESLWLLWQLAITGESLLIVSPHASTCSQAVLAYTSLIAPLKFQGDCRPYYTVCEADFDALASRQNGDISRSKDTTVIGTTNPFFMKAFSQWPNALIFPFLERPSANEPKKLGAVHEEAEKIGSINLRIPKNKKLDDFENSHRPMLLRRCPRYVVPDVTVLHQLISSSKILTTCTTGDEGEPYVSINNAILRKHFRRLTKDFLQPFEEYFGIWKASGRRSNLYMNAEDYMKPFTLPELLSSVQPRKLLSQIKQAKWKALYTAFVKGPHFEPWFKYRRQRCIHDFTHTLRNLRDGVDAKLLLSSPFGANLSQVQYSKLKKEMQIALKLEKARTDVDPQQIRTIKKHLKAVKEKLSSIQQVQ